MTAERRTGRLPGVQIVAYAPPFAPVWDPILVAARQAAGTVRQADAARVR
jgi:hypothetical protein